MRPSEYLALGSAAYEFLSAVNLKASISACDTNGNRCLGSHWLSMAFRLSALAVSVQKPCASIVSPTHEELLFEEIAFTVANCHCCFRRKEGLSAWNIYARHRNLLLWPPLEHCWHYWHHRLSWRGVRTVPMCQRPSLQRKSPWTYRLGLCLMSRTKMELLLWLEIRIHVRVAWLWNTKIWERDKQHRCCEK